MLALNEKTNDRQILKTALEILPLNATERAEVGALVYSFRDGDGLRAVFARDIVSLLTGHPTAKAEYERFSKTFPTRNPFAFMPLGEVVLRIVAVSKALWPQDPLATAMYQMIRESTKGVFGNPAMQIAHAAAGGNLRMFIELTMSGEDRFGNYIKDRELRVLGPKHIEVHAIGTYPALEKLLNVPYAQSMFEHFGVEGHVALEAPDERESVLTLQWR